VTQARATRERGFTLIELMTVTAIIAVLVAIALPNLVETRKAAHEAGAVMTLRAFVAAQQLFRERDMEKDGVNDYAESEAELRTARLLFYDDQATPFTTRFAQSGYAFEIIDPAPGETSDNSWRAVAIPLRFGKSGDRTYFVDESGVIRFSSTAIASPDAAPDDFSTLPSIGK